ncbi:MFS transporter [Streptomyces sp. N2-109]|uniref:MFS transporter n=1 Tax=Streptomyces gossypii TaxID=2883101 RepID=A0ABT2JPC7_9ACTN|nr:MFS transporter [Streptomyces gossypii]MCT2589725.1 MFS transporter [Streptomyces gossypii]
MGAVALSTFTVVTSEMLPVGLLTPMGRALGVSEGTAGLTLTITGVLAALSAPLITLTVGRRDRRTLLVALMTLLAAANLLAAWSPNFAVMVLARVLVGFGMGGVWTLAAGLAVRLVPAKSVASATSLIFSGVAVASVLGVPAGTYLGDLAGWRAAFAGAGGLALLVAAALTVLLPRLPAERAVRLGGVLRLLREPRLRTGLTVVALLVTAHFAAYTYVRPVLEDVAGVGPALVGTLLLVYGVAGVAGNFASGTLAARSPRTTVAALSAVLAAAVLLLPALGGSVAGAVVVLAVWGVAYGGVSVGAQTWLMASAPEQREAASSLFVGVFNGSIALGALTGGLLADGVGVASVTWLAGALAAGATAAALTGRAPAGTRA